MTSPWQASCLYHAAKADLMRRRSGRLPHSSRLHTGSHPPAFRRASAACFRALLAMLHLVLRAFFAASLANLRAHVADRAGKFAAPGHVAGRHPAYLRAIHVQPDAARHHLHILLVQT